MDISTSEVEETPESSVQEITSEIKPETVSEEFVIQPEEEIQPTEVTMDISTSEVEETPESAVQEITTEIKPETVSEEFVIQPEEEIQPTEVTFEIESAEVQPEPESQVQEEATDITIESVTEVTVSQEEELAPEEVPEDVKTTEETKPETLVMEISQEISPETVTEEITIQPQEEVKPSEIPEEVSVADMEVSPETQLVEQQVEIQPDITEETMITEAEETVEEVTEVAAEPTPEVTVAEQPEVTELSVDTVDLTIQQEVSEEVTAEVSEEVTAEVIEEVKAPVVEEKKEPEEEGIAPKVIQKPKAQVVDEGVDVTFECKLTANPQPEIIWYKDEVVIESTGRFEVELKQDVHIYHTFLTVRNVELTDAGKYKIVARNTLGETTTVVSMIVKEVQKKVDLKAGLKKVEKVEKMEEKVEEEVVEEKIQMPEKPQDVTVTEEVTEEAISETVSVSEQEDVTETMQVVKETETVETVQEEKTIKTGDAPRFTRALTTMNVVLGQPFKLEAELAPSDVKPTVKWFKNEIEITDIRYMIDYSETLLTLTVDNSVVEDTGTFTVLVTNDFGECTSSADITIIFESPAFTKPLYDINIILNDTVTLECTFSGIPEPEPQWFISGVEAWESEKYHVERKDTTTSLTVTNVNIDDTQMEYLCKITNPIGEARTTAKLFPQEPPKITKGPENFTVTQEETISITCYFTGLPAPTVTWYKTEETITPSERYRMETTTESATLTIPKSLVEDTAEYTLRIENPVGADTFKVTITVIEPAPQGSPPEFIVKIKPSKVKEGDTADFSCKVIGEPEPELTWYFNDQPLEGTGHYTLVEKKEVQVLEVFDVVPTDAGEYTVTAKNPFGEASCVANLDVKAKPKDNPPEFTEVFPETTIEVKKNLVLTCKVIGKPEPTAKWFRDDDEIKPTFKNKISKQKDVCTLTISGVTQKMSGVYKCVAKNPAGEAVHENKVTVTEKMEPPVFVQKPLNKDVKEEGKATFSALVKGKPLPEITWLRNDEPFEPTDKIKMDQKEVKGELALTLTFDKCTPEDACQFKIQAKNPAGEATCGAKLGVQIKKEKPKFLKKPADQEVPEQEDVTFETEVIAKPEPDVEWFKGETKLEPSEKILYEKDGNKHTLTLKAVEVKQTGVYNVKATNIAGTLSASAKLKVIEKPKTPEPVEEPTVVEEEKKPEEKKPSKEPPQFIETYPDTTVEEKKNLELKVKVTGKPKPDISWFRDGKEVAPTLKNKITTKDDTSVLKITAVTLKHSGVYKCVAKNSVGTAEHVSTITVTEFMAAPVFVRPLSDKDSRERQRVRFDCTVSGTPKPEITWFHKETPLENSPDVKIESVDSRVKGEYSHTAYLDNCTLESTGEVKAVATNKAGEATSVANLVIQVKKEMPKFLKKPEPVECMEHDEVRFVTSVSGTPEPTIEWYRGEAKLEPSDRIIYDKSDNVHTLIIKNVKKDEEGMVTVKAVNELGDMAASARLRVTAVQPPKIVKPTKDAIAPEQGTAKFSAKITGFPQPTVTWYLNDEELPESEHIIYDFTKKDNTYHLTLTGDLRGMTGKVKVIAKNNGGEASCESQLTIRGRAPTFIEKPLKCTILEDHTAVFRCRIDGDPMPTVEWSKGKWRKLVNNKTIRIFYDKETDQHVLEMDNTQSKDAGTYTVTITNEYGTDNCPATLMVTNNEEEVQDWVAALKKTEVQEKVTEEEEVDWRSRLKKGKAREMEEGEDDEAFKLKKVEVTTTEAPVPVDEVEITELERQKSEFKPTQREDIELEKQEPKAKKPVEEKVKPEDDKDKYQRKPKEKSEEPAEPFKLVIPKAEFKFVRELEDMNVVENEYAVFECEVNRKKVPVDWYINDKTVEVGPKYQIFAEDAVHRLSINMAKPEDHGEIKCIFKKKTTTAKLTVEREEPPYFTRMLDDVLVKEHETAEFIAEVHPPNALVVWFVDNEEVTEGERYNMTIDGPTRILRINEAIREDEGKITAIVGEAETYAYLEIEIEDEYEIVTDRLLFEMRQEKHMKVIGEFLCARGGVHSIELTTSDNDKKALRPVEKANQRRWVVKKIFLDNMGSVKIDKWAVKSYVDYTCSAEALDNISRGFLNDVSFSKQTVEFILELTRPNLVVKWLKDGFPIHDDDGEKYLINFEDDGTFHTLRVYDVQDSDEGVYTFKVNHRRSSVSLSLSGINFTDFLIDAEEKNKIKRGRSVDDNVFFEADF